MLERENFHPLVHLSPNSRRGWSTPMHGLRISRSPMWVVTTQALGAPFTAFQGALVGSWIGGRAARTRTSALLWEAGIAGSGLTGYTTMLTPRRPLGEAHII